MSIKTERRLSLLSMFAGAALLLGIISAGCASSRVSSIPSGGVLSADSKTADRLDEGRSMYLTGCAECHRRYKPEERSPEDWKGILSRHRGRVSLTRQQFDLLEGYLISASAHMRGGNND